MKNSRLLPLSQLLLPLLLVLGCGDSSVDLVAERAAIMRLHDLQREAHLRRDAAMLVSVMSDDFLQIARGDVGQPTREKSREMFENYFARVEFDEWDDIRPPDVRISADGTLAITHVHKRVTARPAGNSAGRSGTQVFAWTSVYQKREGQWILTSITSTDKVLQVQDVPGGETPESSEN